MRLERAGVVLVLSSVVIVAGLAHAGPPEDAQAAVEQWVTAFNATTSRSSS